MTRHEALRRSCDIAQDALDALRVLCEDNTEIDERELLAALIELRLAAAHIEGVKNWRECSEKGRGVVAESLATHRTSLVPRKRKRRRPDNQGTLGGWAAGYEAYGGQMSTS